MRIIALVIILCSLANCINAAGDLRKPKRSFTIDNHFKVWYEINTKAGTFTAVIECYHPRVWFGLGLGTRMLGADITVLQIRGNTVDVSDRRGPNHAMPQTDVSLGGKNDVTRLGYEVTDSKTTVKIRRRLNTGDTTAGDKVIKAGPTDFIWAYGSGPDLAYHGRNQRGIVRKTLVAN